MQKLKRIVRKFRHWMAYEPPGSLSAKGWRLFNKEFEEQAPIRWYIHRQLRRNYIWPIKHKIEKIMQWIRYRMDLKRRMNDLFLLHIYYPPC